MLCKTFLKLKVTTIILVVRPYFPQEILKQLHMDYKPSVASIQKCGTLEMKQFTIMNEFKAKMKIETLVKVRKLYLPTL